MLISSWEFINIPKRFIVMITSYKPGLIFSIALDEIHVIWADHFNSSWVAKLSP
jgi:hypothetical protein